MLLASKDRGQVIVGCDIARSLGREDLLADLAKLLDSMDYMIRNKAKEAIDSIQALARLKREALMKEQGLLPK